MILCLTPNPAIDRTMYVNTLNYGEVHRAQRVLMAAGGKGLNVARAIHSLGGEPFCMGLNGGHAGNLFADLASAEGLPSHWTKMKNETRTCIILVQQNQDATVINEAGAGIDIDECQTFIADVLGRSSGANLVCVSGSLPPGFLLERFESLLAGLTAKGKSVWVDTSGEALKTALGVRGLNIKVNAAELGEALGLNLSSIGQVLDAIARLRNRGILQIAVTLGSKGAVLSFGDGSVWTATPPQMKIVSSVGSGDAFLGGLVFAIEAGYLPEAVSRCAVAAGAANALHFGGGSFLRSEFDEIVKDTTIKMIDSSLL